MTVIQHPPGRKPIIPAVIERPSFTPAEIAVKLFRYLELDAATQLMDWKTIDDGEELNMVRDLAGQLATSRLLPGPDSVEAAADEYFALEDRYWELRRVWDTRKHLLPQWAIDEYSPRNSMQEIYLALAHAQIRIENALLGERDDTVHRFVHRRILPGLNRLEASRKKQVDAALEAVGLHEIDSEQDRISDRQGELGVFILRTPVTTLGGALGKLRYHLHQRRNDEGDDTESAPSWQLRLAVNDLRDLSRTWAAAAE